MKELNLLLTTSLLALLFWIAFEVREASDETFINADLLEISQPIDGTIDIEYLMRLEPADVQ